MEEMDKEIPSLSEISSSNGKMKGSSNEMKAKMKFPDHNPVCTANENGELSSDNSKEREEIREEASWEERQNSFEELKTKWLCEAESSDSDSILWSKMQYVNQCEEANNCIDYLVSNEMTTVYASVSKLFKSFKSIFASNQKLKNKVFELASQMRSIEKRSQQFEGKISERDERIQYLERVVDADVSRIQAAEKAKQEVEHQLEDLRRKFEEAEKKPQEELDKTANVNQNSLFLEHRVAQKDIDILTLQLTASRDERDRLQAENVRSQSIQDELRTQIRTLKEELAVASRQREDAQVQLLSRNKEARKQLDLAEALKREVQALKVDLDATRHNSKGLTNELKSCENKLKEALRHCDLLNKNLSARQFHLTVLKTQKTKLEEAAKEKHEEAESLKAAISKVTSTRNDLARKVSLLEQKLAHLELEKQSGNVSAHPEDHNVVRRRCAEKDKEIRLMKLEIKKLHIELNSAEETLKRRAAALKTQETMCDETKKEIGFFHRQSQELRRKIQHLEDEKQKMSREISQLTTVRSDMQNRLRAMERDDIAKDQEISRLKQEIEKGEERIRFCSNNEYATRKQLQKTRDKLREAMSLHQAFTESTQQQIERIRTFEDQVRTLQKQVVALKVTNNDVTCTLKQLERRNGELCAQVECKDRDFKGALKSLEETQHELEVAKTKIQRMSVEKSAAEYELAENQKELAKRREEGERLAIDLARVEIVAREKESEIQIFKGEVESLRRSLSEVRKALQERESMQKQLVKAKTLFDEERLKCKALEEELQRPRNIHRWRFLEGTDTPVQQLMLKCVHLQKLLMKKSNLLSKMENELRNNEKVIKGLAADRKSRSEVEKKLWSCQKELLECKNEIKCLLGERLALESLSSKHANQIQTLQDELRKAMPARYKE